MNFTLHTTKKAERDLLLKRDGESIKIKPEQFHKGTRPIVWEEDTGQYYEHSTVEFFDLLRRVEMGIDLLDSDYYRKWAYKGTEIETRIRNLPRLFLDIKRNGIREPVHCEITGERLDGSYRTKIAMYLGIKEIPAILHQFKWRDIDEEFIERKVRARNLAFGRDYYYFKYGYKDWENITNGGGVYQENADRWDIIKTLVNGSVLDLGCNEGYISIQLARNGHKVTGIDLEWIELAWLNKLIFEWIDKKDIDTDFHEESILDTKRTADTILFLNVLYHLPKEKQAELLKRFKNKRLIFQCNLRKEAEREKYYTSHPDDLITLLKEVGRDYKIIDWRDKPIVICE